MPTTSQSLTPVEHVETPSPDHPPRPTIDPRGPRFTASVTVLILAAILLLAPSPAGIALLVLQTVFFGLGAGRGVQHTPTAWAFKRLVRPRLSPPDELEDAAPPRFAQGVGLAFAVVALAGYATGLTLLGQVATGLALVAAILNAAFAFCLGCELYLLIKRLQARASTNPAAVVTRW